MAQGETSARRTCSQSWCTSARVSGSRSNFARIPSSQRARNSSGMSNPGRQVARTLAAPVATACATSWVVPRSRHWASSMTKSGLLGCDFDAVGHGLDDGGERVQIVCGQLAEVGRQRAERHGRQCRCRCESNHGRVRLEFADDRPGDGGLPGARVADDEGTGHPAVAQASEDVLDDAGPADQSGGLSQAFHLRPFLRRGGSHRPEDRRPGRLAEACVFHRSGDDIFEFRPARDVQFRVHLVQVPFNCPDRNVHLVRDFPVGRTRGRPDGHLGFPGCQRRGEQGKHTVPRVAEPVLEGLLRALGHPEGNAVTRVVGAADRFPGHIPGEDRMAGGIGVLGRCQQFLAVGILQTLPQAASTGRRSAR